MTQALTLVDQIRGDLQPVVQQLVQHPYIEALDAGQVPREQLRAFVGEQHAIITSDLRSVGHLVGRYGASSSRDFFLDVLQGEKAALVALQAMARALGMSETDLDTYEPLPGAHAYTCYMAWLGFYGSAAEVAAAYLVNFPAWGENCGRLSRILKERYGLAAADVAFFDHFAAPAPEFESAALAVIQVGLDHGVDPRLIHRAARLLQGYELMYWNQMSEAAHISTSR
jgi:thiaminase